jgi:hypothetical protein
MMSNLQRYCVLLHPTVDRHGVEQLRSLASKCYGYQEPHLQRNSKKQIEAVFVVEPHIARRIQVYPFVVGIKLA